MSANDFKYLSECISGCFIELLKHKRVDPYECMKSFKTFSEDKLPDKCQFYSSLKSKYISEKKYLTSINVWNSFIMNTLGHYHDHFLKGDALLLADVFEMFINTCLEYNGLGPCHCFGSPGLSWEAMLKMIKIELDFIHDIDKYFYVEKGIRGSIYYIAKRYSKANNKYMQSYDVRKLSK